MMKVLFFISSASFASKALAHFMIQADLIPINPVTVDGADGGPCCQSFPFSDGVAFGEETL